MNTAENYEIAVCKKNIPWSSSNNYAVHFSNGKDDIAAFESYLNPVWLNSKTLDLLPFAFNRKSSILASLLVNLDIVDDTISLNELLNTNYVIVREILSDNTIKTFYYFVTENEQRNARACLLSLTLDIFATYKIGYDFSINNILTDRIHLNRFTDDSTISNLQMDIRPDSDLNISESFDSNFEAQITEENYVCNSNLEHVYGGTKSNFNLKIIGWLVGFFSYSFENNPKDDFDRLNSYTIENIQLPYKCFVAPILSNSDFGFLQSLDVIGDSTQRSKLQRILPASYFYKGYKIAGKKITTYRKIGDATTDYTIYTLNPICFQIVKELPLPYGKNVFYWEENNNCYTLNNMNGDFTFYNVGAGANFSIGDTYTGSYLLMEINNINKNDFGTSIRISTGQKINFTNNILDELRKTELEPKIFKFPYTKFELLNKVSNTPYDYNIFDIKNFNGNDYLKLDISTNQIMDISGVYNFDYVSDSVRYPLSVLESMGLGYLSQLSLPGDNNEWANYTINNKNYLTTGILLPTLKSVMDISFSQMDKFNYLSIAKPGLNFGSDLITSIANIENVKAIPDTVRASTNIWEASVVLIDNDDLNSVLYSNLKTRLLVKKITSQQKNILFDYFYKFGYSLRKSTSSDQWFNRVIFNYVKTAENSINKIQPNSVFFVPMSEEIKKTISDNLENGITFLEFSKDHLDLFDKFGNENWEKNLL